MSLLDEKETLRHNILSNNGNVRQEVFRFLSVEPKGLFAFFKKSKHKQERWNHLENLLIELLDNTLPDDQQENVINGILDAGMMKQLTESRLFGSEDQNPYPSFQNSISKCILRGGHSIPFLAELATNSAKKGWNQRQARISEFGAFVAGCSNKETWGDLFKFLKDRNSHGFIIFHFQRLSLIRAVQTGKFDVLDYILEKLTGDDEDEKDKLFRNAVTAAAEDRDDIAIKYLMQKTQFTDQSFKTAIVRCSELQNQPVMLTIIQEKGTQAVNDLVTSNPTLFKNDATAFVRSMVEKYSLMKKHGQQTAAKPSRKGL